MSKTSLPDKQVLDLIAGHRQAFDYFYQTYSKSVYTNIVKIVKQPHLAEDILHEVFMALWENREKFDPNKSVAGWLFVVSYNKSLTLLKKKIKESILFIENYDLFEPILAEKLPDENTYLDQLSLIENAALQLSPRIQEVFRLIRFEGKTEEEVALHLGVSRSSVKDYLKLSTQYIKAQISQKQNPASKAIITLVLFISVYNK